MYTELVRTVWSALARRTGSGKARAIRETLPTAGPLGDQDAKTASPGTYRPVGATCPSSCPYLQSRACYAEYGNVAIHQRRASAEMEAAIHAAIGTMVWAAQTERTARLHVAGDLGKELDLEYIAALCEVAREVKALRGGDGYVAWTYTHHPDHPALQTMREAGIAVRLSDRAGDWGAVVVADRDEARDLRETGVKVAVCPAQLGDTNCAKCTLCWSRPDITIGFLAHGPGKGKV
jgi:hypothetical protein